MMQNVEFLPWQIPQARDWLLRRERFAHAWLIHGAHGAGELAFAAAGAASLLCEAPVEGLACGHCEACRWVQAGNHPDLRRIRPDAVAAQEGEPGDSASSGIGAARSLSRDIRIEQIRELMPWFNLATHRGGWRVTLLYPAEALNRIAANALLKILEEPPEHSIFLVVASTPDRLLPTLLSRCRRLPLPLPPRDAALAWLKAKGVEDAAERLSAAGGAPVAALAGAQAGVAAMPDWIDRFLQLADQGTGDAAALADTLAQIPAADWVDGFQRLWLDLSLAHRQLTPRYYPMCGAQITRVAARAGGLALADAAQWLQAQRRLAGHPLNPKFLSDRAVRLLLDATRPAR